MRLNESALQPNGLSSAPNTQLVHYRKIKRVCHVDGRRHLMSIQASFSNYDYFLFILQVSDFVVVYWFFFSLSIFLSASHLIISSNHYGLAVE